MPYVIEPNEWEKCGDMFVHTQYPDESFTIEAHVYQEYGDTRIKFLGVSNTWGGDSAYYYDIEDGKAKPFHRDYPARLFIEDGEICEKVHLSFDFVKHMEFLRDYDSELCSIVDDFITFADEHGLDLSTNESTHHNLGAYLCHTLPGGMSYGFGNVPQWRIEEVYSYGKHYGMI